MLSEPSSSDARLGAKQSDESGTGCLRSGCVSARWHRAGRGSSSGKMLRLHRTKTRGRVSSPRERLRSTWRLDVGATVRVSPTISGGGAGEDHLNRGGMAVTGAPARGVLTLCRNAVGGLGRHGNATRKLQEIPSRTIFELIRTSCSRADIASSMSRGDPFRPPWHSPYINA